MTDKEKTLMFASLSLGAIIVVILIMRRAGYLGGPNSVDYTIEGSSADTIINEGDVTNGVPNNSVLNSYFNSENNVNVNTIGINELSQKYIPMFGLVGMTSVGNIVINQQAAPQVQTRIQAPAPVYYAATKQPEPYQGYIGQYNGGKPMSQMEAKKLYDLALQGKLYK